MQCPSPLPSFDALLANNGSYLTLAVIEFLEPKE